MVVVVEEGGCCVFCGRSGDAVGVKRPEERGREEVEFGLAYSSELRKESESVLIP